MFLLLPALALVLSDIGVEIVGDVRYALKPMSPLMCYLKLLSSFLLYMFSVFLLLLVLAALPSPSSHIGRACVRSETTIQQAHRRAY